jgi:two-component system, chemotaxis family, protein-glutamate methylesterase/glutaminase
VLQGTSVLPVVSADHGAAILPRKVYVAPSRHHLVLKRGYMQLTHGPRENRARPSIDVLFRSAALAYGPRVVGVLLSGLLDDGVAGLIAIKRCGGTAVAQDPDDAPYPDLPANGIRFAKPEHVTRIADLPTLLQELVRQTPGPEVELPGDILAEANMANLPNDENMESVEAPGDPAFQTCPECGGTLRVVVDNGYHHFRCHTGHAYGQDSLLESMSENSEQALWAAIRILEERKRLLDRLARYDEVQGRTLTANSYRERLDEVDEHVKALRLLVRAEEPMMQQEEAV